MFIRNCTGCHEGNVPLQNRFGTDIGLLQIHAPIAQRLEWDFHPRDGAEDVTAGRNHPVLAIQIMQSGRASADIAFKLVHVAMLARA